MYRKIVTEYWSDPVVEQMGWAAKYVLLYLLTSPLGNIAGCYVITTKRIAKDTELDIEVAENGLREVVESGLALYCDETHEVLLKSWPKHNWNPSPNIRKGLLNAIELVKCEAFRKLLQSSFEAIMEPSGSSSEAAAKQLGSSPTVSVTVNNNYRDRDRGTGEGEGKSPKQEKPKPSKHSHGEFGNVMLTDDELEKLKERFPDDWESRINDLSYYIGSTGKSYTSHYRTILSWERKNSKPSQPRREVRADARWAKYR